MFRTYCRIVLAAWRTFGCGRTFWRWLLVEPLYRCFTFATLWLDSLFFPELRAVEVRRPLFIIGHPRSGTTFLHGLLTRNGEYAAFTTWQLLFPALIARKLMRPLIDLVIRKKGAVVVPASTGHEIALDKVEEEEMLFLHNLDTQFVEAGTPLGFDRAEAELTLHDNDSGRRRLRSARFLKSCFQRQIMATGRRQIVAQIHFSTHRIKTLLEVFPDARFVYLVRSPLETIPSFLSLLYKSIDFHEGIKNVAPERLARYFSHRYEVSRSLYHYFETLVDRGHIPAGQFMVLPYEELRRDLASVFRRIRDVAKLEVSEALVAEVDRQAAKQQSYQRRHEVMELAAFGLDEARIVADFAEIFRRYGFPTVRAEAVAASPGSAHPGSVAA